MLRAKSNRVKGLALGITLSAVFSVAGARVSLAQSEPPLSIPEGGPPPKAGTAIPFESWLFYPQINAFTVYSDNLFFSPQSRVSAWGFGLSPSLTAEWSNGIHTRLYTEISNAGFTRRTTR